MLTHQVYFWLKEPDNLDAQAKLKKGLERLLTVETMHSGHIGIPAATPARDVVDHSYSFAYYTTFVTLQDHEVYQTHPIHLEFVRTCEHLWAKVQVYDYSLID
jgi:hypothetical protein